MGLGEEGEEGLSCCSPRCLFSSSTSSRICFRKSSASASSFLSSSSSEVLCSSKACGVRGLGPLSPFMS